MTLARVAAVRAARAVPPGADRAHVRGRRARPVPHAARARARRLPGAAALGRRRPTTRASRSSASRAARRSRRSPRPARRSRCSGRSGRGFDVAAAGSSPLLVGGGFGAALLAPLSRRLPAAALLAAFRDADAARAAELVPAAEREIALPPANVLELLAPRLAAASSVSRGGARRAGARRRRGLRGGAACRARSRSRRPMACGYGACYGCAVRLGGRARPALRRGPGRRPARAWRRRERRPRNPGRARSRSSIRS